jgi:DHA3 family macrolide efflux protein-like MFS transporter
VETKQTESEAAGWQAPFFTVWTGQAFSLLGSRLAQFALVWWLTETTGSATVLASATLVALLPQVLLGPIVGALVDRSSRRRVLILADGAVALAAVWLVYLFWMGTMQVWHVYLVVLVRAIGGTFHWPAMVASTSLMVPREHLSRVQGLNQALQGIMSIAAPPLGALLLGFLPLYGIMAIDVVTAVLAIVPLFVITIPQPQQPASSEGGQGRRASFWDDVRAGVRYIRGWPGLLAVMAMAMLINLLLSPAYSLLPILVTGHFGGVATELGWLQSALGVGVVVGGLVLSVWGGFRRRITTSLFGLIGMGLGNLIVGLVPSTALGLALGGMFVGGLMNPITNGPLLSVMQATVDPEMQGRVFTLAQSGAAAMTPLGLIIAGPMADRFGAQVWFVFGGIVCMLMGILGFFWPAVMHLESSRRGEGTVGDPEPVPVEVDLQQ